MRTLIKIIPLNGSNFNFKFRDNNTKKEYFDSQATREELIRFMNSNTSSPEEISYAEEIIESQSQIYLG